MQIEATAPDGNRKWHRAGIDPDTARVCSGDLAVDDPDLAPVGLLKLPEPFRLSRAAGEVEASDLLVPDRLTDPYLGIEVVRAATTCEVEGGGVPLAFEKASSHSEALSLGWMARQLIKESTTIARQGLGAMEESAGLRHMEMCYPVREAAFLFLGEDCAESVETRGATREEVTLNEA